MPEEVPAIRSIRFTQQGMEIEYAYLSENVRAPGYDSARAGLTRRINFWYDLLPEAVEQLRAVAINLVLYAEEVATGSAHEDE